MAWGAKSPLTPNPPFNEDSVVKSKSRKKLMEIPAFPIGIQVSKVKITERDDRARNFTL